MDICSTTAQKVLLCTDDLTGSKVNASIILTRPQNQHTVFSKDASEIIGTACEEVCEYLREELELQWTGVFRAVLTTDPSKETFKIDFYYEIMIFGKYTEQYLKELIEDITQSLTEIETVQEESLTLDFTVRKAFA